MYPIIGDVDELVSAIQHASRGEEEEASSRAEREAERIRTGARKRAQAVRDDTLKEARERAARLRSQTRSEQIAKRKGELLREREQLLDEIWREAEERLRALTESPDYEAALHRLSLIAVRALGSGRWILAADEKGHRLLTPERLDRWSKEASDELGARVSFERDENPAETWGGLLVTEEKRRRWVDATFATRLQLAREEIRELVFSRLVAS